MVTTSFVQIDEAKMFPPQLAVCGQESFGDASHRWTIRWRHRDERRSCLWFGIVNKVDFSGANSSSELDTEHDSCSYPLDPKMMLSPLEVRRRIDDAASQSKIRTRLGDYDYPRDRCTYIGVVDSCLSRFHSNNFSFHSSKIELGNNELDFKVDIKNEQLYVMSNGRMILVSGKIQNLIACTIYCCMCGVNKAGTTVTIESHDE